MSEIFQFKEFKAPLKRKLYGALPEMFEFKKFKAPLTTQIKFKKFLRSLISSTNPAIASMSTLSTCGLAK